MPSQATSRRGRPPATDPAATRRRIVATATDLFARQGFHATGVAEIGRVAGVQPGALYYHIGSKDELLWEILSDYITAVRDRSQQIAAAYADPLERLRALIANHVEMIIAFREQVTIELRDRDALTDQHQRELQVIRDGVQRLWQSALDEAHAAGAVRSADHVLTNAALTMASMVARWYREGGTHSPTDIATMLGDLLLHGIATSATSEPATTQATEPPTEAPTDQPTDQPSEPEPKGRQA